MILKILFLVFFFLPVIFQIFYGVKAIRGSIKLNLREVVIISLIGQFFAAIVGFYLMSVFIKQSQSHDGLPMVGVLVLNSIMIVLLLVVVLIQTIISFKMKKRNV